MSKRTPIACLLFFILPLCVRADWQIVRIDAVKDDVYEAKMSMNHFGEAAIVFTQMDTAQAPPARRLFATLYDPSSQTFTSPVVVDAGIDDNPDNFGVSISDQGNVTVAFSQYSAADTSDHLFVNKYAPGSGWSGATGIYSIPWPGAFHDDPKVGYLSTGAVVLFYLQDTLDTHVLVAYREPGNSDFIHGATAPFGPGKYVLSTNGSNRACVAYEFYTADPVLRIYSSRFGYPSSSWSSPELVDRDTLAENIRPSLSLSANGEGFLVFGYNEAAEDTLFANTLDTLAGWAGTTVIDSGAGDISMAWEVDADDFGNALVVYNKWATGLQGFGRYFQSGSGWSSPEAFTGSLGDVAQVNVSFDTVGNAGVVFEFVATNRFIGSNALLIGPGWQTPDTVYGPSGILADLDGEAYGTMRAVAIFIAYADTNKLYAAIHTPTGVEEAVPASSPSSIKLTCSPVPFTSSTTIRLSGIGHRAERIELQIFDLSGRLVQKLVPCDLRSGALRWDGRNASGEEVAPGIYFVGIGDSPKQKIVKVR